MTLLLDLFLENHPKRCQATALQKDDRNAPALRNRGDGWHAACSHNAPALRGLHRFLLFWRRSIMASTREKVKDKIDQAAKAGKRAADNLGAKAKKAGSKIQEAGKKIKKAAS